MYLICVNVVMLSNRTLVIFTNNIIALKETNKDKKFRTKNNNMTSYNLEMYPEWYPMFLSL